MSTDEARSLPRITRVTTAGLALLSAMLSVVAFTSLDWGAWAALIMFVPALVALRLEGNVAIALCCYAVPFSTAMFFGTQHYSVIAYLVSIALLSLFMAVPLLLFRHASRLDLPPLLLALTFAAGYTLWDWAVAFQTWFPIGRLGGTLAGVPELMRPSSVVGPFAVGFVVAFVNAAIAVAAVTRRLVRGGAVGGVLTAAGLGTVGWLLAGWSLAGTRAQDEGEISVVVIQGAVTRDEYRAKERGDQDAAARVIDRYLSMTRQAQGSADVVIWPETALWGYVEAHEALDQLMAASNAALIGGFPIGVATAEDAFVVLNAVLYLEHGAAPSGFYAKRHLMPLFESGFSPGFGPEVITTRLGTFATPVCFEAVLTHYMRGLLSHDSGAVVVLSNDAGFGPSLVSYYMLKQAMLHAVAANRYLVRAGQSGVSAIVDAGGRVVDRTELFEQTVLSGNVRLTGGLTTYIRFGDWSPLVSSLLLCVAGWWSRQRLSLSSRTPR